MNYIFNQQPFPFQQPSAFFTQQQLSSQGNTDSNNNNVHHSNASLAPPKQKKKTSSILATKNLIRERLLRKIKAKNGANCTGGGAKGEMRQSNFEAASKALSQALFLPMSSGTVNSQSFVFAASGNASCMKKSGSFDAFQTWINYDDEALVGGGGCNPNAHNSCTSPASETPILTESNQLDLNCKLNTLSGGHFMGNSTSSSANHQHSWWGNTVVGGGVNLPINSLETFTDNSCGNVNSNNTSSTATGYYEMLQNPVFFEEFMSAAMSNSGSNSTLYYKNASLDFFQ